MKFTNIAVLLLLFTSFGMLVQNAAAEPVVVEETHRSEAETDIDTVIEHDATDGERGELIIAPRPPMEDTDDDKVVIAPADIGDREEPAVIDTADESEGKTIVARKEDAPLAEAPTIGYDSEESGEQGKETADPLQMLLQAIVGFFSKLFAI